MDGWCAWASTSARLRAQHFGYHLYTHGDTLFTFQLIDWERPKEDFVVWENETPMTLNEIIQHVSRRVVELRAVA